MRSRIAVLVVTFLAVAGLGQPPAGATHPGANGPFVFADTDATGITTVGADGAVTEIVEGAPIHLEVSPDGRTVLHTGTTDSRDISIVSLAGGPTQVLVLRDGQGGRPDVSWSPDGSRIVVADGTTVTAYDADGSNPQLLLDTQTDPTLSTTIDAVLWTGMDEVVAIERFRQSGARIDMSTGALTYLASPTELRFDTQYGLDSSPDGQQLAISCIDDSGDTAVHGVCILDRDLVVIRHIPPSVVGAPRIEKPAWSPDGTRIAFVSVDFMTDRAALHTSTPEGGEVQTIAELPADPRFQGNNPDLQSWARVPDTPPQPLEEPPPPPTNSALVDGGFDGDPTTTERADFTDPTLFAVAVSRARFADGAAAHAVVSRNDAFPDSLVGAALTGDGPLLYTATNALPPQTFDEIARAVGAGGTVYLLGGTAAIAQAVEDQLAQSFDVRRLAGPSRVETSVAVAQEVRTLPPLDDAAGDEEVVAIARAAGPDGNPTAGWADSVTSGAWTAAERVPTVVTATDGLHPAVAAFLQQVQPDRTVLLGGTAALSPAVEDAVEDPERIAGGSRAGTAQAIAELLIGDPDDDAREAIAINGYRTDGWLFGLPVGGLAADTQASIALITDPLPPESAAQLCDPAAVDVLVVGGLGIITEAMADQIEGAPACAS